MANVRPVSMSLLKNTNSTRCGVHTVYALRARKLSLLGAHAHPDPRQKILATPRHRVKAPKRVAFEAAQRVVAGSSLACVAQTRS